MMQAAAGVRSASLALQIPLSRQALTLLARNERRHHLTLSSCQLHSFALKRDDDEQQERARLRSLPSVASYHTTAPSEKGVALVLGLGAVSATAFAASSAVRAYKEWKESQPEAPPEPTKEEKEEAQKEQKQQEAKQQEGKRENIFAKWFNVGVGSKYYEGGFEDTMTRKEAALILGVRESSTAKRIKEAHRKLLVLNHPDTGGSTYMAGKINEAKELLLKGKKLS